MTIRCVRSKLAIKFTSVVVGVVTAVALLPVQEAQALGNNRDVNRSCGVNHVASGAISVDSAWAETTRVSGDCTGRLSAGLRSNNGFTFPRVYGTRDRAYAVNIHFTGFGTGMHWGCDNCNVTYS